MNTGRRRHFLFNTKITSYLNSNMFLSKYWITNEFIRYIILFFELKIRLNFNRLNFNIKINTQILIGYDERRIDDLN